MFTGIIETTGHVAQIEPQGTNLNLWIDSPISHALKVDQSVAHNGVCLTVVEVEPTRHCVTAIQETLEKSNFKELQVGSLLNLERCMLANDRFDGHIVQGHVDQIAKLISLDDRDGSWIHRFQYDSNSGNITVEKGSICINGVSLTVLESSQDAFSVAIIPYTYENTNFKTLNLGDTVNLEFDIIGKYVSRLHQMYPKPAL